MCAREIASDQLGTVELGGEEKRDDALSATPGFFPLHRRMPTRAPRVAGNVTLTSVAQLENRESEAFNSKQKLHWDLWIMARVDKL